jgi:hypothetical protein
MTNQTRRKSSEFEGWMDICIAIEPSKKEFSIYNPYYKNDFADFMLEDHQRAVLFFNNVVSKSAHIANQAILNMMGESK